MILTMEPELMKYPSIFGEFFKARRQALGLTLREFCLQHKLDPGNISRLERGLLPPPRDGNRLAEYAKCLGLKKGNGAWHAFFDLAAVSKGRIPAEMMTARYHFRWCQVRPIEPGTFGNGTKRYSKTVQ